MIEDDAAPPPPPDVVHLSSTDVDHVRFVLSRYYYPITLTVPREPERFEFGLRMIQLGPLTVGDLSFRTAAELTATEFDGYHVLLPTCGDVLARQAGIEVTAGREVAAVFRPGSPVSAWHTEHSRVVDVKISPAALEAELCALLGRPPDGSIDLPATMRLTDGTGRSWGRLIQLFRDELDCARSLIRHPLIAEQLRHTVMTGLLLGLPHRYHTELTEPARPAPPRAIERALQLIHDEPDRPLTVTDLAAVAGMSVRSVQDGFRRHVGCAPMAYLQQVRLERAHEALRQADSSGVTVATVAHRWGFAHLGRFASAYRKQFGTSPSETLRGSA